LFVTGVSAQTVNKLKKAGVLTVEQALRCYPRKYQEFARFNAGMQVSLFLFPFG
jgi:RecG-like helicase